MTEQRDLTHDVTAFARDALHVAVGLGVMGIQRAQVHRVEVQRRLGLADLHDLDVDEHLAGVRDAVATGVHQLDGVVGHTLEGAGKAVKMAESAIEPLAAQLRKLL